MYKLFVYQKPTFNSMKGVSVSVIITIIFVVLVILTIVAFIPTLKENTVNSYCKQNFLEIIDEIKYRSCQMNDMDLEYTEKIDTTCIQLLKFQDQNSETPALLFKIKESNKEYVYDTGCPKGFYGYVSFDFSLAGDERELKIQKNSYSFLISPKKAKLIFCQGVPDECKIFNDEKSCENQIGCSWSVNTCSGNPKSCYELKEDECQNQKGCETI
jgi:hypothetical protein